MERLGAGLHGGFRGLRRDVAAAVDPRITSPWARRALRRGAVGETRGNAYLRASGETILHSQRRIGTVDQGFDSISYIGQGQDARLFINEFKRWESVVPASKFTTFGLGKSGIRTFDNAMRYARRTIENSVKDEATRRVLLRQLDDQAATIRVIGGRVDTAVRSPRLHTFVGDSPVLNRITETTGFRAVHMNLDLK